jgi:probable rRNA maturation factor
MQVEVQYAVIGESIPTEASIERWVEAASTDPEMEIVVRIVDTYEITKLNTTFRGRTGPTNVLSFPFEPPPGIPSRLSGDVVVCAPVVAEQAREQGKEAMAHWAHMIVHGVLHLRGFDHQTKEEARRMESLEIRILEQLGYDNPYE